jgi:hypothetical protein
MTAIVVFGMQSLADVAQKEAERRKQIEQQGVEEKVIVGNGDLAASDGNLTVSTPSGARPLKEAANKKNHASVQHYRSALQKLDRIIRQNEIQLESLRARLQSEKWALQKIPRNSKGSLPIDKQTKLQEQINTLQAKTELVRQERNGIYQSGKRDGYLPGELDGKGIIP